MTTVTMRALLPHEINRVWEAVTDLENWQWRSDLKGLEVVDERTFVETDAGGVATTFTITAREPWRRYAFQLANENITGQWEGLFQETEEGTAITFTEAVSAKSRLMGLLVKPYLKRQQQIYLRDLRARLAVRTDHAILFDAQVEADEGAQPLMERAIRAALAAEGVEAPCEINVLLTDDAGIHHTNLEMRGVDRPTDVLSFPMFDLRPGETLDGADADPATGLVPLGDMCISLERAAAQAAAYGHSVERELSYLTVHSVLHLLGYDHLDEGPEKAQMRAREDAVMAALDLER